MVENKITAKWARDTAEKIKSKKNEAQLRKCEDRIKEAVNKNHFQCTMYESIDKIVRDDLESRGFEISMHNDQRDGDQRDGVTLNINW